MTMITIALVMIPAIGLLVLLAWIDSRDRKKIGTGKDVSLRRREQRQRHSLD